MKKYFIKFGKFGISLFYRFRFASFGKSIKIFPPLLLKGTRNIQLGNSVVIEQFAGLTLNKNGRIIIGNECEIRCFSRLEAHNGFIFLGERTSVNPYTLLSGFGGLTIGNDVRIASHCVILTSTHDFSSTDLTIREQGIISKPTQIEDNVWIGTGCTILGGIKIGCNSIIGAGTIVTHDVPCNSIFLGIPGKVIKKR